MMPNILSKAEVRSESLHLRDTLTGQERARYSQMIVKELTSLTCYRDADILLTYVNYRSEVETLGLIRQALSESRLVFVPKVIGRDMEFYQISDLNELQEGYRGILEPKEGLAYPDYLMQNERPIRTLVCMPGAAFDKARHRIGYGGGFYDRYLVKLAGYQAQGGFKLTTAALAYSCQVLDNIPWEPHDVLPNILLTEQGSIY